MLALLSKFGIPVWVLPVAGFVIGLAGATMVTRWYYRAQIARMDLAQAQAKIDATEKARAKDAENSKLAADLDLAHMETKDALDKLASATHDLARTRGLWVKTRGNKCVPGTAANSGSSETGAAEVRLSDETSDWLIAFAHDADRAALYAKTCHDWAMKVGK